MNDNNIEKTDFTTRWYSEDEWKKIGSHVINEIVNEHALSGWMLDIDRGDSIEYHQNMYKEVQAIVHLVRPYENIKKK